MSIVALAELIAAIVDMLSIVAVKL